MKTFALDADPLVNELVPVAQQLTPTLSAVGALSPDLERLFVQLRPLITASETGFPALADVLRGAEPLLAALQPFLEQLNPILGWLSLHQQLLSDFISVGAVGLAAKTTAYGGSGVTCGRRAVRPLPAPVLADRTADDRTRRQARHQQPRQHLPAVALARGPSELHGGREFPGSFALPSWDCRPTGAPGNGSRPATATVQACWVAPTLPGAKPGQIPHLLAAHYPNK